MTYVISAPDYDIVSDLNKWLDRLILENEAIVSDLGVSFGTDIGY
jgi:hypothetical protein